MMRHSNSRRRFGSLAICLTFLLALCMTACSSTTSASNGGTSGGYTGNYEYEDSTSSQATDTQLEGKAADDTIRKIVRTFQFTLETQDFDTLLSRIQSSARDTGGYLENFTVSDRASSRSSGSSKGLRSADITARIPQEKVDGFCAGLEQDGNVIYRSEEAEDITLSYSDVKARCDSLRQEQGRLQELMESAETIEDLITLQERLSQVSYQIESYESQLRTYDSSVDYSTVSISITEVEVLMPTAQSFTGRVQQGFSRSLDNIAIGLVNFAVWFLAFSPYLLLMALPAAVVLLVIFVPKRRRKNRRAQAAPVQRPIQPSVPPQESSEKQPPKE